MKSLFNQGILNIHLVVQRLFGKTKMVSCCFQNHCVACSVDRISTKLKLVLIVMLPLICWLIEFKCSILKAYNFECGLLKWKDKLNHKSFSVSSFCCWEVIPIEQRIPHSNLSNYKGNWIMLHCYVLKAGAYIKKRTLYALNKHFGVSKFYRG